jgi:DNA-binding NtrC family response regulator
LTSRILLVDDDALFSRVVRDRLERDGIQVTLAHTGAEARALAQEGFSVALVDGRLPDERGLDLVEALGAQGLVQKFVIVTGYPEVGDAITAFRRGIVDFLTKPADLEEVRLAVLSALRTADLERTRLRVDRAETVERARFSDALPAMAEDLRAQLTRAAASSATLLMLGETGTGKTSLARAVHLLGGESRPFVSTNCAAIPDDLLESELFGSDKGGFTGATARPGLFELAHGGTLFLDEIGELSLRGQAKVLSVVEDGLVRRIGAATSRRVSIRLIAATNRPLEEQVRAGTFREDLYYRLSVLTFRLPPLRERGAELSTLVHMLLADMPGGMGRVLAEGELERLGGHPFPGNLRELRNVLERSLILGASGPLTPSRYLAAAPQRPNEPPVDGSEQPPRGDTLSLTLEEVERRHIAAVLDACEGNRTKAAARLGIGLATLRRFLSRERTRSI